jgi:hypothetical protein
MLFGISYDLCLFIAIAIAFGALAFRVGMHFPAERESDFSRQVWASADVLTVFLTVIGIAKLMSPLLSAEQAQRESAAYSMGIHAKERILLSVNKAQDQFCPVGVVEPTAVPRCNAIRDMQRTLLLPTVDAISARHILKTDFPAICLQQACEQTFQDIYVLIKDFLEFCEKNPNVFSATKTHEPDDILITLSFIGGGLFITLFRLGRSGSEFSRNRKAWRDRKNGKKSTDEQIAAIRERLDRIDPPTPVGQ